MKKYIIYAGVNGAGKSTLYRFTHIPTQGRNYDYLNTQE